MIVRYGFPKVLLLNLVFTLNSSIFTYNPLQFSIPQFP